MKIRLILILSWLFLTMTITSFANSNVQKRKIPAPTTVSEETQKLIQAEFMPYWNDHPKTHHEWKQWAQEISQKGEARLPLLREKFEVEVNSQLINQIQTFSVTPKEIAPTNRDKVILHFHGGGYILNSGESGTDEAIMMAGIGNIKVISVDYRMPPDAPFPAAMNDAFSVYKALLIDYSAKNIGIIGTSTGGGMALSLILMAKEHNIALPGAIVAGTPWSDLTKTGDSYLTHEGLDNVLVSYDGWLGDAARLYANGVDLKNPLLSPIYGDLTGFPPTLLVSGTRDLFLSNTVRIHQKLRQQNSIADLIVMEGLSHAQYLFNDETPESHFYFSEAQKFFNNYLGK